MQPLNGRRQLRIKLQPMPPARRAQTGARLMLLAALLGLGGVAAAIVALIGH